MDKFYAVAIVAMIGFAILFVVRIAFFNKQDREFAGQQEIGLMAIKLLRDMQCAEKIDARQQRIPRMLALIEERDRLLSRVDKLERDELISQYSQENA